MFDEKWWQSQASWSYLVELCAVAIVVISFLIIITFCFKKLKKC